MRKSLQGTKVGPEYESMPAYYDSHSHLSDPRLKDEVDALIARAESRGIRYHLQGGVGPEDWARQKELKARYPGVICCFGLHPYWVAEHSLEECESALDLLSRELTDSAGIGEMGLDLRPQYVESQGRQTEIFEQQIEMAQFAKKPMVLHLVRAFDEAVHVFEIHGVPSSGGMVHSFNGSAKQAEKYLELGLHISVGGPLARPDNQRLRQAVQIVPMERLLLETDSPDQPPPRFSGAKNEPESIWDVAKVVAEIKKISAEEVLDRSSQNLKKLFSL